MEMPSGRTVPFGERPAGPAGNNRRVLVVDDEPLVREVVARYLEREGFAVDQAADGSRALELLEACPPDLIILDVMLPAVPGLEVLGRLRASRSTPVILLTARGDEADRVIGLEQGADDYVVKPFSPRELVARVQSVLRRADPHYDATRQAFGRLVIDYGAREVFVDGDLVETTAKEFDLLAFLAASPRQVFSRNQLLGRVWDASPDYRDRSTVTVHIRRLRQKIEAHPEQPRWIRTVWGVGYRFDP